MKTDVTVQSVADVEMLNKRDGHFAPYFDQSRKQIGIVDVEGAVKANWKGHGTLLVVHFEIRQVSVRQGSSQLIAAEVLQIHAIEKKQVSELDSVDGAETIKLKNAGD